MLITYIPDYFLKFYSVGKTALLKQYLYSKFTPSYKSTYCADFETKELKVKDQNVLLQVG